MAKFLRFENIATILTLVGVEFLKGHLEKWRESTARTKPGHAINFSPFITHEIMVIQHVQSFVDSAGRPVPTFGKVNGVFSSRETASFKIGDGNLKLNLIERRYSLMLKMFLGGSTYGQYLLISVVDDFLGERISDEFDSPLESKHENGSGGLSKYDLLSIIEFTGLAMFQIRICQFVSRWESDWMDTLDSLDRMVSVKVGCPSSGMSNDSNY